MTRALILLFALGLLGVRSWSSPEAIRLVGDPWCPYACESNSDSPGIFVEMAKSIFSPEHEVQYSEMSWSRALTEVREGKFDAIIGALQADAPDFLFPKSIVTFQESCFITHPTSKFTYSGLDSLMGLRLGLVKDYKYGEPFDSWVTSEKSKGAKMEALTGTKVAYRLLKKLEAKRNDVIIDDRSVIQFNLSKNPDLKHFKPRFVGCLSKMPLYIAFSPKSQERSRLLIKKFDEGFKKLKKEKKLSAIYKKYSLVEVDP